MILTGKNQNTPAYVSDEPQSDIEVFRAGLAHAQTHAEAIAKMYEEALGPAGLGGEGMENYPDPDLFTAQGVESTLRAGERILGVARFKDGELLGAMVMDFLSPYHIEFNSMAVKRSRRGLSVGSRLVEGLSDMANEEPLRINTTELVTHSIASQAAHFHAGLDKICGFAFCHYPHVFFKDHPESVLWVSRLQGRLVPLIKQYRASLGRRLGSTVADVVPALLAHQARTQPHLIQKLTESDLALVAEILRERTIYVPSDYLDLASAIVFQFEDVCDRIFVTERDLNSGSLKAVNNLEAYDQARSESEKASKRPAINLEIQYKDGFGHSYIDYKPEFVFDADELDAAIQAVLDKGKRYIQVRIPANQKECIDLVLALKERGFAFMGLVPLYGYQKSDADTDKFYDVIIMQYIASRVLTANALPGDTESVVKIYGYPLNLSGALIARIKKDLAQHHPAGDR